MPEPELSFFIGKGGVGKTTVAAAFAVRAAQQHRGESVLLLSTDPAHSLSDVLQVSLRDHPTPVPLHGPGSLKAWELNSQRVFARFLAKHKKNILSIIDAGSIISSEDIGPLLDTALPGIAEVSALLSIHEAMGSGKYSRVVVDTAPFGHTLRLFALPQNFLRFLDFLELAASRDRLLAQHFGGSTHNRPANTFISEWRTIAEEVNRILAARAELFLVTTAEKFSLNESLRCARTLAGYSPPMQVSSVILNRCVTGAGDCRVCRKRGKAAREAQSFLKKYFPGKTVRIGEDPGALIAGIDTLSKFAKHVFSGVPLQLRGPSLKTNPKPAPMKAVRWPVLQTPLTFVLGKGGVGKTTISAALGFRTRKIRDRRVQICSVDPAPSLDDIFQKPIGDQPVEVLRDGKFRASEMDSASILKQWVEEIRANIEDATGAEVSGVHLDLSFERQLLSALLEIVPPGIDEVLAIFRILDLLREGLPGDDLLSDNSRDTSQNVLIDMAPTGHALELLRMPDRILAWTRPLLKTLSAHRTLAGARDAAVKIAELGQKVRQLARTLKDDARTRIHVVLLPELLPDRETERLISGLQRLGLIPASIFINRVVLPGDAGKCKRCLRTMQSQQKIISQIKKNYADIDLYAIRNFPGEIAGKASLMAFTKKLWRLA